MSPSLEKVNGAKKRDFEKGHCHAGERADCGPSKSEDKAYLLSPSGYGKEAHRRVWRIVGVRVGLPCHEVEVEGVVVKDNAVLVVTLKGKVQRLKELRCCNCARKISWCSMFS